MPASNKRHVTFYADKFPEVNRLFDFKINNLEDALACISRFKSKGYSIRCAWFHDNDSSFIIERRDKKPSD